MLNRHSKNTFLSLLIVMTTWVPAACGEIIPWPEEGRGDEGSRALGVSKLAKLDQFRDALLKSHASLGKSVSQTVASQTTLKSALYSAIVKVPDLIRSDIYQVFSKLLTSKANLCGGADCVRVLGIKQQDLDEFLDQAYSAAQASKSLKSADREAILRALRPEGRFPGKTLVFGHRGASASHSENSLSAVRAALESVQGAEIDIQLSRDDVPFVLHDDTLRRTAAPWADNAALDGKRLDTPVGELNWNDIKSVSIGPRGEKVPTLKAVLDELGRHTGKSLLVEIKSYDEGDKALQQRMIAGLNKTMGEVPAATRQKVILISFDKEVLRLTKEASNLKDAQRYWLLTGAQIEDAAAKGQLKDILSVAKEFSGLDIESGPYLSKSLQDKSNIVELIQKEQKKVIVWISRRQRTDGLHWLQVARNLGVDIFTSDLPIDVLFPARREARAKEAATFLKSTQPGRPVTASSQGDKVFLGSEPYAFYAPIEADFRGLSPVDREKALATDIAHLRQDTRGVVVSLADLTQKEQKIFLEMLRRLPSDIKGTLRVLSFKIPSGGKDISVIDLPSAKSRLKATRGGQGRLESL